jgi:hypothetical protein
MPSTLRRKLFNIVAALAVVLASFWIALEILDYLGTPADPNADRIEVTEASYGMNCQGSKGPNGQVNQVKAGNVTAVISKICTEARESCRFMFESSIGDPAPGCGKDLLIGWRCGADATVNQRHVAGEAHSKTILLACPPP